MSEVDHLDGRIGGLATAQGGVVSREQAIALGASRRAIEVRLGGRRWVGLHRGVYAVGHVALTARGKAIGALLAVPGAILSHRTAGAVWAIIEDDLASPDVSLRAKKGGARTSLRLHQSQGLASDDITTRHDLPVTTVPRTLLDLADVCTGAELAQAVREARIRHHMQPEHFLSVIERSPGRHGAAALKRILDGPGGEATRSQAERAFLSLVARAGLPRPEVNTPIGRYLCDFGWTVHRFTRIQIRDEPIQVIATTARLLAARG